MESTRIAPGGLPASFPAGLDTLERLMDRAWPALERSTADGWVLRSAGGVTQRANSILPVDSGQDAGAALRRAANWYADRRQPVIFQLTRRPENAALEEFLDGQGYSRQSETVIMTAATHPDVAAASATAGPGEFTVGCADTPDADWLNTWWSVDGRGGAEAKQLGQDILTAVPSIYAAARNSAGDVIGTGRLTVVDGWGGVYCMATHPDFRRQGVAAAILEELKKAASAAGADRLWLMVTAANTGAQALYAAAGFEEAGRYHYRQAPLRRAFGAC